MVGTLAADADTCGHPRKGCSTDNAPDVSFLTVPRPSEHSLRGGRGWRPAADEARQPERARCYEAHALDSCRRRRWVGGAIVVGI